MEEILGEDVLEDVNILSYETLPSPAEIKGLYPVSDKAKKNVLHSRKIIKNILDKKDKRLIALVGPCSIHNIEEGIEYAHRLKTLSDAVSDVTYVVMRAYLEKPRTTIGWKGLLYEPDLNGTADLEKGIVIGRNFLIKVNELGLPCANEFLRTDTSQYIADLISWGAIGARTTESQPHRELASGFSMPIGFKNNTSGDIQTAVDGCLVSRYPHSFPGIDSNGKLTIVRTKGNHYCHVVLRGGNGHPNYHPEIVERTLQLMRDAGLPENVIIDCSHANSQKIPENQIKVAYGVLGQILDGNRGIAGIMLESNLNGGNQSFPKILEEIRNLKYGVSLTDACISWEQTEKLLRDYAERLRGRK